MKREEFKLRKLKVNGGVVEVDYVHSYNFQGVTQDIEIHERRIRQPHPDLNKSLQMLNVYVARTTHLDALDVVRGFLEKEGKKETKVFVAQMIKNQSEILDSIDVRSITIKGENDKVAVVISSVLSCRGNATALNTPRIPLSRATYGVEEAIAESIDEITTEVFAYLFEGKEAQLQMPFDQQNEDETT